MNRIKQIVFTTLVFLAGTAAFTESPPVPAETEGGVAPDLISQIAARLIAEAIPHEYERTKDWGRTREITTGLRSSGNFFDFDIHRRKTAVKHGVWKAYRMQLVKPAENLVVRIDKLRSADPGRIVLTLFVTAKLQGWARAKIYDRGIHIVALEAEGHSSVRLWLDAEIAMETVKSKSFVPGVAIRPVVTDARLKLDNFQLTRISNVGGSLVHELGDGLRHLIEDELDGPKLVAKLNRSIDKRRDRLEFTPEMLLGASSNETTETAHAALPR